MFLVPVSAYRITKQSTPISQDLFSEICYLLTSHYINITPVVNGNLYFHKHFVLTVIEQTVIKHMDNNLIC